MDVGGLGVIKREVRDNGEIWFYVPYQVKNLTFTCYEYKSIPTIPVSLKEGSVYKIKFDCATGGFDRTKRQELRIIVQPVNAEVQLEGVALPVSKNGIYATKPYCGSHTIEVSAENYHSQVYDIILTEPDSTYTLYAHLKQNFGWLQVNGQGNETITINGKSYQLTQNSPSKKIDLKSGSYELQITRPLHKPFVSNVMIEDSVVFNITPSFIPNYKEVYIAAAKNAEIVMNGVSKGYGSWVGKLEYGNYVFETRLKSHTSGVLSMNFNENSGTNIQLPAPTPQYGNLIVNTNVSDANIYLDNKPVNPAALSNLQLLIGDYTLKAEKPGYKSESRKITINEGQTTYESFSLSNIYRVTISGAPSRASIYVDNQLKGGTTFDLVSGEHELELRASGYRKFNKKIKVEHPSQVINVKMAKRYYYPDGAYLTGDVLFNSEGDIWGGMSLGGYMKNINIEVGYQLLFSEDETIYWSSLYGDSEVYNYTANMQCYKIGYGLIILSRLRLTPQIGINYLSVTGKETQYETSDHCGTFIFPVSGKLSFAISPSFDLYASAEYMIPFGKSELYSQLANTSTRINGWSSGLRFGIGLGLFF